MAFSLEPVFKKLSNAKTRTFVILLGSIVIVGIVIAVMQGTQDTRSELAKQGSQAVAVPSEIQSTPGSVVSEQYRELLTKENQQRADEALKSKTSAIPTIIGGVSESPASRNVIGGTGIDGDLQFGAAEGGAGAFGAGGPFGPGGSFGEGGGGPFGGQAALDRQRTEQEARLREQREQLEKMRLEKERQAELERQRQANERAQKEFQQSVQQVASQMKQYANGAYSDWSTINAQQYVSGVLAQNKGTTVDLRGATKPVAEKATVTTVRQKAAKAKPRVFIKAGTVMFGVMDTAVNTDEPGPVLATILSGKLQGAKLVGNFQHEAMQEAVLIQFNQMSIPKRARSLSVQAVAIDPDTARTALATDVNRHILLRYGSIFASAFISGYGKAITQQGTTTVSPLTGTTTTQTPELDNRQIFFAALGELGTQWGQAIKPYFNTPYTVSVDQGTGIGVLFLTDVDISEEVMNG